MELSSVRHKGLKRFVEADDASGLPADFVEKIRNLLSFMQGMDDVSDLKGMPEWQPQMLKGSRRGTWSLTVSRNWRLTFQLDRIGAASIDLDYEDYR